MGRISVSRRNRNSDDPDVAEQVRLSTDQCLDSYRVNPDLVAEHFGIEQSVASGGYDRRQIFELVQNGADAILEHADGGKPGKSNTARIEIILTDTCLYCANEGAPVDADGVKAILGAFRSRKRGNEIGRFGLGFKSVLGVSSAPEFHSTSGSFRFDQAESELRIRDVAPGQDDVPILRLAFPIDSASAASEDRILEELLAWATTVVRLRLDDRIDWLEDQLVSFPEQFLLFSPHVTSLVLDNRSSGQRRSIEVGSAADQRVSLSTGGSTRLWQVFSIAVAPDEQLRDQAGELQGREELPLSWAVPIDRPSERGGFWAFFPMENDTTLRGILNAPWKTNSDRQIVLQGAFNEWLIDRAVELVLTNLHALQTPEDPARYL
ncbi:MAG: sacsin N-terminal ATP-binding-like domain-containing protein, partial [Microthrixaceae bacterium]